ncbi:MAG TPA: peptidylprolyl isomerase [Patescibacteria group bacterium]
MNRWAVPLIIIVVLIFGVTLFLTQGKPKSEPDLPQTPTTNMFQSLSLTPGQQPATQSAQSATQPSMGVDQPLKASYSAVIQTTRGNITVTLRTNAAPHTVVNFMHKALSGFYKNLTFHRVEDWVIQGGDPEGTGAGGGQMPTEINPLPFTAGSLGVARRDDIRVSNDAQFFITKTDASWLNQQYTNFGQVTEGMDVVNKIQVGDKILGITVQQ